MHTYIQVDNVLLNPAKIRPRIRQPIRGALKMKPSHVRPNPLFHKTIDDNIYQLAHLKLDTWCAANWSICRICADITEYYSVFATCEKINLHWEPRLHIDAIGGLIVSHRIASAGNVRLTPPKVHPFFITTSFCLFVFVLLERRGLVMLTILAFLWDQRGAWCWGLSSFESCARIASLH